MPREAIAEDQASERLERAGIMRAPPLPLIELAGVEKVYRMGKVDYRALRGVDLSIAAGRDGGGRRAVGERQVDDPEHDHGDRPADGRDGHRRRAAPRRDERGGARGLAGRERRDHLPVLPAAADALGARERGPAARLRAARLEAGALRAGAAQPRARRARRQARPPPGRALGRRAAARRDRALARGRSEADRGRRADRATSTRSRRRRCSSCSSG